MYFRNTKLCLMWENLFFFICWVREGGHPAERVNISNPALVVNSSYGKSKHQIFKRSVYTSQTVFFLMFYIETMQNIKYFLMKSFPTQMLEGLENKPSNKFPVTFCRRDVYCGRRVFTLANKNLFSMSLDMAFLLIGWKSLSRKSTVSES